MVCLRPCIQSPRGLLDHASTIGILAPRLPAHESLLYFAFQKFSRFSTRFVSSEAHVNGKFPRTVFEDVYVVAKAGEVPEHIDRPKYAQSMRSLLRRGVSGTVHEDPSTHVEKMRRAGLLAAECRRLAMEVAKPGTTSEKVDNLVHQHIISRGAYPAAIGFHGFPKSICISPNEVACHGIPSNRPFEQGDMVSFDCTCFLDGVFGDCCGTVIVGTRTSGDLRPRPPNATSKANMNRDDIHQLLNYITYSSLLAGIDAVKPGVPLLDIPKAIQNCKNKLCEEYNHSFATVEDFCGHFIGEKMHLRPYIRHTVPATGMEGEMNHVLAKGDIFTIEPIMCEKSPDLDRWKDGWTVTTKDCGWCAQWEHTVLVTDEGCTILTKNESLPT